MQIDSIHERTPYASLVVLHLGKRARACGLLVAQMAARARVRSRDQHESRGERDRTIGAGKPDLPGFHRLADTLQNRALELGELIEEEHAVVRERDLARAYRGPSPD